MSLELTDEIYDELVEKYRKVVVIKVDDDSYVVRYPNKIEYAALKNAQLKSSLTQQINAVESIVKGQIVWPENEIIKDREECDGGLITQIVSSFMGHYMNRAVTEEKKS